MKPLEHSRSHEGWNWRKNLASRSKLRLGAYVLVALGLAAALWVQLKPGAFRQMAKGNQEITAGVLKETSSRISGGMGILVTQDATTGLPEIVAAPVNSPASLAGLKAGDVVTHADGESLGGLAWQRAYARLQGPSWSSIDLTIQRRGKTNAFVVTVRRTSINRLNQLSPAVAPDFMIDRKGSTRRLDKL